MNQLDTMLERDVAPAAGTADMKLEVVVIPVSDVDRAKRFYGGLGWRLDADFVVDDAFRGPVHASGLAVLDPLRHRASHRPCRARQGTLSRRVRHRGSARRAPRSRRRRERIVPRPVPGPDSPLASGQRSGSGAAQLLHLRHVQRSGRQRLAAAGGHHAVPGSDRLERDELRLRSDLASAMRRASAAHGEHEKRMGGQRDENWPDWYAAYMVAEQAGKELPS